MAESTPVSGATKEAGWYPDRANPNVQNYWDGQAWSAQRLWESGTWVDVELGPATGEVPVAEPSDDAGPLPPAPRPAAQPGANPYQNLPPHLSTPGTSGAGNPVVNTVTLGMLGVLVCSVIIIIGSLTPWVSISLAGHAFGSANGTDSSISDLIGINGWLTFAAGLILFLLVGFTAFSGQRVFRLSTLGLAVVTAGLAIYCLVRILQKISNVPTPLNSHIPNGSFGIDVSVAYGLIILLIGALGAVLFAFADFRTR
jgi:hypothetical protein